eukprot:EC792411.1.p3 GENE.EC792411.1~~EC792411.1.p3  ORF type:complete len:98 (-),score=15.24 EC792411.1:238-531(-)
MNSRAARTSHHNVPRLRAHTKRMVSRVNSTKCHITLCPENTGDDLDALPSRRLLRQLLAQSTPDLTVRSASVSFVLLRRSLISGRSRGRVHTRCALH